MPWAHAGAICLPPDRRRCLIRLSRGGADAVEVREFDMETRQFIDEGFFLPEAKQTVAWVNDDALLFTTTTRDDRVHPGHARKMAALMGELGHDLFYFENTEGGHGAGVTSEQRLTRFRAPGRSRSR